MTNIALTNRKNLTYGLLAVAALLLAVSAASAGKAGRPARVVKYNIKSSSYGSVVLQRKPAVTPRELGVPFYPKAKLAKSWAYDAARKNGAAVAYLKTAILTTPDAPAQVSRFYLSKLGKGAGQSTDPKTHAIFLYNKLGPDTVTVQIAALKPNFTRIEINRTSPIKR